MKRLKTNHLLFLLLVVSSCTSTNNWNQYLGPDRNSMVINEEIISEWPAEGPKELWSQQLGPGFGGVSIFDEEVYILDREKGEADILRCFDLNTGQEKWKYRYEAKGEIPYPGSRTVPYVDKNNIWCVGPHGHFHCIDKKTQKPLWSVNLQEEFNAVLPNWGFSQSPLVHNNLVIVAPQGEKAGIVAFDKLTGELVWKSRPLTGYNFHVSPVLANYGEIDQVVIISPYDRKDSTKIHEVVSFDAESGKELWKYNGLKSFATITPPTVIDNTRLFLTDCSYDDNYKPVSVLLEISLIDGNFFVNEVFKTEEAGCKMHPAIFVNNHLYFNNNGNPNQLVCMNLEGKLMWEKGSSQNFEMGSIILVNDLLIAQNGKNGDIHVVEPSPEGYREIGKATYFNSEKTQAWSPMAFSQGKLLARDMEKLVCIDFK